MKRQQATRREARILLVDDDPGTIRLLSEILKGLGKMYFTTRGAEAITLAQAVAPDIILLDVEMSDRHGFVVCQEIRRDPLFADVPILFVTAHTELDVEARALEAGALDFIAKPPHPAAVRARVSNYLALKFKTDQLRALSKLDGLTGVSNRRAFDEALHNEWRRACRSEMPLSLLLVDIDYFKSYNDTLGHQAGDDCLRAVANCLATRGQRPGDVVARYGGEEFVLLLPDCPFEHAIGLAEGIRQEVSELEVFHADLDAARHVTVSIGVSASPALCRQAAACWRAGGDDNASFDCDLTPEDLIRHADKALYRAKQGGRNRVESATPLPACSSGRGKSPS